MPSNPLAIDSCVIALRIAAALRVERSEVARRTTGCGCPLVMS